MCRGGVSAQPYQQTIQEQIACWQLAPVIMQSDDHMSSNFLRPILSTMLSFNDFDPYRPANNLLRRLEHGCSGCTA
jgi:hypothetical protein